MANFGCWVVSKTPKTIKLRDGTDADSPSLFIGSTPVWLRHHLAESFRGDSDLVAINDTKPSAAALKKQDKDQAAQRKAAFARKVDARARMFGTAPPGVTPPAGGAAQRKTVDTSAPGLATAKPAASPPAEGFEPDPIDASPLDEGEHVDPEDIEPSPLEGIE